MAKIRWSQDAIEDLKEICKFIASDSPFYAKIFNDRVFEMAEHLESFPKIGRRVPEADNPDVRELIYKRCSLTLLEVMGFFLIGKGRVRRDRLL